MLVVLLGTLLPLVHKQLGLGSISVGSRSLTPCSRLMVPACLLLEVGPLVRWGGTGRVTSGNCCSPPRSPRSAVGTLPLAAGR